METVPKAMYLSHSNDFTFPSVALLEHQLGHAFALAMMRHRVASKPEKF
jgi:hypothetical protein